MGSIPAEVTFFTSPALTPSLSVTDFLNNARQGVIFDVRSPGEFANGHIPGAVSFPLFTNEERAIVGTLFKKKGKSEAMLSGLEIVGPKLRTFVEKAYEISQGKLIFLHCWRGGMRSASMAVLLQTAGLKCQLLKGGYKAYRKHILAEFEKPWHIQVIGGKTGSGKTSVLHALQSLGKQVIDLEGLAHHKGSAFGKIGELPQPSTEQFGNNLYQQLSEFDRTQTVWLEDESQMIGKVFIPTEFYSNYRSAPLHVLDIPFEQRVEYLVKIYGNYPKEEIIEAFSRIKKKLGGQHLNRALQCIETGDISETVRIALYYYDKTYLYGLEHKDTAQICYHTFETLDPTKIAKQLSAMYP